MALLLVVCTAHTGPLTTITVGEGDNLQGALDAARPGDTILLARGARFTGNFVVRAHPDGAAFITVRTAGSELPGPGVRTDPRYSGALAVIQSPNTDPALRTAPGAHHWRLENIEFAANAGGEGSIIALGSATQRSTAEVPHTLILDRLYIHGDAATGQKRGIALNSASTDIINSYIADIKGVGFDTQAIAGWNGPGPYRIENNYLEAAGENVMFGGSDPSIQDLVPADIVVRRNLISRPVSWRDPILAAPAGLRGEAVAAPAGATAKLPAAEYVYRVVAERPLGGGAVAVSMPGPELRIESAGGAVRLQWDAVTHASGYRVYRSGPEASAYVKAKGPEYVDAGEAGRPGAPPKRGTVWSVKNLFELKNARNVTVDGNVLEHHWGESQSGYAILFTPRNQNGTAPWTRVEQVRFINNVVRKVAAGINISGTDSEQPSGRTTGILIQNNLFEDVDGGVWGGPGDFLQIGDGPADVHVEGNTVVHTGRIAALYAAARGPQAEGFVFRNNLLRHNKYGFIGQNAAPGKSSIDRYLPGAVFEANVIAGGESSRYPGGNRFVSDDEFTRAARGGGTAGVDRRRLTSQAQP